MRTRILVSLLIIFVSYSVASGSEPPSFLSKWFAHGTKAGVTSEGATYIPDAIATDQEGNVYVAYSWRYCIQKFTNAGKFVLRWNSFARDEVPSKTMLQLAVDRNGYVYVSDAAKNCIKKFTNTGESVAKWGKKGSNDGQMKGPSGIAIDQQGFIFIADEGNCRIQKFTGEGAFVAKWGSKGSGEGQFLTPVGIAVDQSDNVYVVDTGNNRVQKFSNDGLFITAWGSEGLGDDQFTQPLFIAVDNNNRVYVGSMQLGKIQVFSDSGAFLTKWGDDDSNTERFKLPMGMAFDRTGNIFVCDAGNRCVKKFGPANTLAASNNAVAYRGQPAKELSAEEKIDEQALMQWIQSLPQEEKMAIFQKFQTLKTPAEQEAYGKELWGRARPATNARGSSGNPMVMVRTSMGSFTLELFLKEAPLTVQNFLSYVDKKFYNGMIFHRVTPQATVTGGRFNVDMKEKVPDPPIKSEASNKIKNLKATIGMCVTPGGKAEEIINSPFYINLMDNGQFVRNPVYGKVVQGWDVVEKIGGVKTRTVGEYQNVPIVPIVIESIVRLDETGRPIEEPSFPPLLAGRISFSEPSGNNLLDGDESAQLKLHLSNAGKGNAYYLKVKVAPERQYSDIKCDNPETISRLEPGDSIDVDIPVSAGMNVDSTTVAYTISVAEDNGFDLNPPLRVQFGTRRFRPPKLAVVDYAIDDLNHNRKVEPSEMVTITTRIQNGGSGEALDVKAVVTHGENVFVAGESKTEFEVGRLAPGEFKDIQFSLYTNNRATAMPVTIALSEHYGKFGSAKSLDLPFNVIQKQVSELVVEGRAETARPSAMAPTLMSDIDRNIPKGKTSNPDAIAVVIGNYRYQSGDVPPVEYALEDASTVREYLKSLFGYQEGNILYFENATKAQFEALFGTENNQKGKLHNYVKPGKSDVFIYYCGHGAPDPASNGAYFVPSDCDPSVIALNGYSLDTFYRNLATLPAKSLSVVIDACFSGSSNSGMLVKGASPALMRVKYPLLTKENTQLFLASQADQIASWYPEKRHGLFTYFFLKGIGGAADLNADGSITLGEMKSYLESPTEGVPYYARRIWQREQLPMVSAEDYSREVVSTK